MANDGGFSIFGAKHYLGAVRSMGFRTTAEALFELVDNSIEAGADQVEVFAVSTEAPNGRMAISTLAVLDNGGGMDPVLLRKSLRFGDGNRFDRRGMGRFGVGLPQASLHQADEIKIWSWQAGIPNAISTALSVPKMNAGEMNDVPEPEQKDIPPAYHQFSTMGFGDHGTLVVWEKLYSSNTTWKWAKSLFSNLEPLVGRVYRRFLTSHESERGDASNKVVVRLIHIVLEDGEAKIVDEDGIEARPLDPMYLMNDTSSDESFGAGPMFEEDPLSPVQVTFTGVPVTKRDEAGDVLAEVYEDHDVKIRCSRIRPHAANRNDDDADWPERPAGGDPGNMPWGKGADKNIGVSVLRADRELVLHTGWRISYEPTERWWGVEVSFPPELDEIMGVLNTKQDATKLRQLPDVDPKTWCLAGESEADMRLRLLEEDPHTIQLLDVKHQIEEFLVRARNRYKVLRKGERGGDGDRHPDPGDAEATVVTEEREEAGHEADADHLGAEMTAEERTEANVVALEEDGLEREVAGKLVKWGEDLHLRVRTLVVDDETDAFFRPRALPGNMQININRNHPFHQQIWNIVDEENIDKDEAIERLNTVKHSLKLLMYSWARMEMENNDERDQIVRRTWGSYLKQYFAHRPRRD